MKLKSILIMTMVAIMAIAGGAFAATTVTTTSTNTDAGGHLFVHVPGQLGAACAPGAVATDGATVTNTCAAMTAAQATALATDSQTGGSGTGFGAAAMPAQVAYNIGTGQYTAGVGPNSGYALNANLFGMCAGIGAAAGTITQVCPTFVPAAGSTGANAIGVASVQTLMDGLGTNGLGGFNQATFATGLVSGFQTGTGATTFNNTLAQTTFHNANRGVGNLADGDYIDQRLAQVIGTNQTMAQSTTIGGSSGTSVVITDDPNSIDPSWVGNLDPFTGTAAGPAPTNDNGGQIQQGIGDNFSGGFGDYGQKFANTDVTVTNNIALVPIAGAQTAYAATGAQFGAPGGTLTLP